ncbi:hypothetical protein N7450_004361 [Penicillium hetheringtonii]|uniref:Uncharacterized protein n=1 Tax=Penicillium hetheringtonii TaxID=911720 RepID=A0AAD6DPV6_9EURO|nr:hypothetical protein N7450_004361 [Penicillium hetheringtonii]
MSNNSDSGKATIVSNEDASRESTSTEMTKPEVTQATSEYSEGVHDSDTDMPSEDDEKVKALSPIQLSIDAIKTFLETDNKAPYPIDLKIEPLRKEHYYDDENNFDMWLTGIEVLARLYRVWPILSEDIWIIPNEGSCCEHIKAKYPKLSMWKKHEEAMVDIACALVYANISLDLRDDYDFQDAMKTRQPRIIMGYLRNNFGPDSMISHADGPISG